MFKIIRPNTVRCFNSMYTRTNCGLKCNDRCINLISEQTQTLSAISKQTQIITIITVSNFLAPVIFIGAVSISSLINSIMH